jgi:molecular chaperone GrpE
MPLVKDLCPFVDNLERALEAAQKNPNPTTILEGIKMVAQQLEEVLARHSCTRIDALDQPFDPNLHQAILQQPAADKPANTVLHVAQAGFQLHDRVVRPAQVIVSSGPQG